MKITELLIESSKKLKIEIYKDLPKNNKARQTILKNKIESGEKVTVIVEPALRYEEKNDFSWFKGQPQFTTSDLAVLGWAKFKKEVSGHFGGGTPNMKTVWWEYSGPKPIIGFKKGQGKGNKGFLWNPGDDSEDYIF